MIEFGKTLRTAREARGYTIAQIAEMTRMLAAIVEDLENENFSHIAAPIYGRGFVKLYCEAVGLDPKPLIDEYMEIYNGNRDTGIKERPLRAPPPVEAEVPPPATTKLGGESEEPKEPEERQEANEYSLEQEVVHIAPPPSELVPETPAPSAASEEYTDIPGDADEAPFSRYGTPFHEGREKRMPSFAPSLWRIGALVAALGLLIFLLFVGVRSLYRATSAPADNKAETAETPVATPVPSQDRAQNQKPAAPREKVVVPQLYVD